MPFLVWCLVFRLVRRPRVVGSIAIGREGETRKGEEGGKHKQEGSESKVLLSPIPLFIVLHFPIFIVTFTFLNLSKHSPPTFHHQRITSSPAKSPSTSLSPTAPAATAAIGWQPPRRPQCLHQVASLHAALILHICGWLKGCE